MKILCEILCKIKLVAYYERMTIGTEKKWVLNDKINYH